MHHIVIVIHILYRFHEIPFSGYLVMAPDRRTDRRTDMDKAISLRLRWGIKILEQHLRDRTLPYTKGRYRILHLGDRIRILMIFFKHNQSPLHARGDTEISQYVTIFLRHIHRSTLMIRKHMSTSQSRLL